jgi:hypothetical protein
MTIYGHRKLSSQFRKILELEQGGFVFEGKHYNWNEIKKIKRYDSPFWNLLFYQGGTPRAYIYLKDGKCIRIRGRIFEQEGKKPEVGFVQGATAAYDELLNLIEEKIKINNV